MCIRDRYNTFERIYELMQTASRTDLKVELIQEVERKVIHIKKLKRTKFNDRLLIRLRKIKVGLEKATIQPGFYFGNDKLLQEIKTRRDSPFGITSIDFPEFHYWLQNQTTQFKKDYLNKKLSSFNPIKDAISTLLQILRAKEKILSDFEICLLACFLTSLWPIMPTQNFFNNWINIIYTKR